MRMRRGLGISIGGGGGFKRGELVGEGYGG